MTHTYQHDFKPSHNPETPEVTAARMIAERARAAYNAAWETAQASPEAWEANKARVFRLNDVAQIAEAALVAARFAALNPGADDAEPQDDPRRPDSAGPVIDPATIAEIDGRDERNAKDAAALRDALGPENITKAQAAALTWEANLRD